MGLLVRHVRKSRSNPAPTELVVDGARVEGYALPPDPIGDHRALRQAEIDWLRRKEAEGTMFTRLLGRVVKTNRERKGPGYVWRIWPRYTIEVHRRPTTSGRAWSFEVYRRGLQRNEWHLTADLWRSR